jgi:hypothetical protein
MNDNPTSWVEYLCKAHEYINTASLPLELDTSELLERLATQDSEIAYLKGKNNTLKTELLGHQTIIEFQRQEVDRYNNQLCRAEMDRDRAVAQAIAPVPTPVLTIPGFQAKDVVDSPTRTTPIIARKCPICAQGRELPAPTLVSLRRARRLSSGECCCCCVMGCV